MSFILLGVLNSQVEAAGGGPAYDLLESTILTTTASAVTFSNLNNYSAYKHLQIRGVARSDFSNTFSLLQDIRIRMNGDTGTNYIAHRMSGYGSSVQTQTDGTANQIRISEAVAAGDTPSNIFSATIIDILDFNSTSKNKTIRAMNGTHNPSESAIIFQSGAWFSTNAITSLELASAFGNYVSGTRFSLYGVKA